MAMLRIFAIALLASATQAEHSVKYQAAIQEHGQPLGLLKIRELLAREAQPQGLPEQGYHGEKVKHENMETMTSDWSNEYGPNMYGGKGHKGLVDGLTPGMPGFPGAGSRAGVTAWVLGAIGAVALAA
mmetsp:Transcript_18252/g.54877  ORF Transcript_18252/g.54877 Transcript_18252/m.54877 type:complete len:128 (-) Transcript_18252:39-422(-)